MMFSSKAEERVDKKDMVSNVFTCRNHVLLVSFYSVLFLVLVIILFVFLLPTGPVCNIWSPETRESVGHYCVVALNVKERRFEFLDSLNAPGGPEANRVSRRMVKNIKRAWKEGSSSSDERLNPPTLDGFVLKHVIVPFQPNGYVPCTPSLPYCSTVLLYFIMWNWWFLFFYCRHDCGFYMFQFLQTWDGVWVAQFGMEHIGYIRKAMLYSWLTSTKCCLDLSSLLIFADKGCFSELL